MKDKAITSKDIMCTYELLNKHHIIKYEVSDVDGMCDCDLYESLEEILLKDGVNVTPMVRGSVKYWLKRMKEDGLEDWSNSYDTYCEHMKDSI